MNSSKPTNQIFTAEEVRERFRAHGQTMSAWADHNGYRREEVYALLHGRTKGNFGRAHEIAVKLGMKPDPNSIDNNGSEK